MEKLKLLIADQDVHFTDLICQYLSRYDDLEICGSTQNGQDALHQIRSSAIDVVLFDLILPGLDGISLLRIVNEKPDAPAMICCTRFYSDVALEAMRDYGADYLLFKPVELQALHPAITTCAQLHRNVRKLILNVDSNSSGEVERSALIHNYLVSLGIPSKLMGCSYLTEAVRLARMDMTLMRNLSKGLYLEISRLMDTTPTRVERCIRSAISAAHQSGALEGYMPSCPSNKEFINYVLRSMEL